MSERSEHFDLREGYVYDPITKGADTTYWAAITGTLTVASNKLRFNNDRHASFIQHIFGKFTFAVNVATRPATNDNKIWGLRNPGAATRGAMFFEIADTTFRVVSFDDFGDTSQTTNLTWDSDVYDAAEINYGIRWEEDGVDFLIRDTVVATHRTSFGKIPLSIEIRNEDADNMDVGFIEIKNSKNII